MERLIAEASPRLSGRVRAWSGGLAEVEVALVILVASWSGPAISRFRALVGHLAGAFGEASPPLLVVDVDHVDPALLDALGRRSHGWGEIFWVKDGAVVDWLGKASAAEAEALILRSTAALLSSS
ncbi:MAG: hypothetical protein R3B09_02715 [Nannocystaceae bacterium]